MKMAESTLFYTRRLTLNTSRKTAVIVGVLFIIGTVAGVLSVVLTSSILNGPDLLTAVAANENQVIIGALLVLTMGLALAMVPVVIFPILKQHNEVLALGYVVFRGALETLTYFVVVIAWLLLIPLSQAFVVAGAADASSFQALGALLLKAAEIGASLTAIVFPLGAAMLYAVLYQSKLIPRWLSVWGLIAVALNFVSTGLAGVFGLAPQMSAIQMAANLPIFLQEMVMAVWLIVKGFNASAIAKGAQR
jgi:hypothetical protein